MSLLEGIAIHVLFVYDDDMCHDTYTYIYIYIMHIHHHMYIYMYKVDRLQRQNTEGRTREGKKEKKRSRKIGNWHSWPFIHSFVYSFCSLTSSHLSSSGCWCCSCGSSGRFIPVLGFFFRLILFISKRWDRKKSE